MFCFYAKILCYTKKLKLYITFKFDVALNNFCYVFMLLCVLENNVSKSTENGGSFVLRAKQI